MICWASGPFMPLAVVSAVGFLVFAGIAWLGSENRRAISWRTVAWGLGLQLLMGLLVFRLPGSRQLFLGLNDAVLALLDSARSGTRFLLGPLAAEPGEAGSIGFILAFQVLPVVIFFSAFTAALYHLQCCSRWCDASPESSIARSASAVPKLYTGPRRSSSASSRR